jgi:hypothetical protein
MQSKTRSNNQIWRIAEYIYDKFYCPRCGYLPWKTEDQDSKDKHYDKAAELLKKIQMNEFTGEDTHKD